MKLPQDHFPWEIFGYQVKGIQSLAEEKWTKGKAIILQHPELSQNESFWLYNGNNAIK